LIIPYMLRLLLEAKTVQINGFQVASLMVLWLVLSSLLC
jgi:hypothetical protein